MNFLAPTTGLIAAGIAVPLLVALYFLKLRRRPVRVSSVMLWQQAVRDMQVNVPFRWLRFNWLLVLQLLALLCLIIAAARPVLTSGSNAATGRIVIVIDASASMAASDGDRQYRDTQAPTSNAANAPNTMTGPAVSIANTAAVSRLDEAKGRALKLIDAIDGSSDAQAMVVRYAAGAQALTAMTADGTTLREAVRSITQTDQPGDPLEAIRLIRTLVLRAGDEAADAPPPTRIEFMSDGGVPDIGESPGYTRTVIAALAGLDIHLNRCGAASSTAGRFNVGIASLNTSREFEEPSTVRVFGRLVNAATKPIDAEAVVSFNGVERDRRVITIPAATAEGTLGEAGLSLAMDQPGGGVLAVRLNLADLLDADNFAGVLVRPVRSPGVVVVSPKGSVDADPFLLAVLDALRIAKLTVLDPVQYLAALNTAANTNSRPFADADLLIFDRVEPTALPAIASVHLGAGVPLSKGDLATRIALKPGAGSRESLDTPKPLVSFVRDHPLLRYVSLETLLFSGGTSLAPPDDAALGKLGVAIQPLARNEAGTIIALIRDGSAAPAVQRIVTSFPLDKSNWGPHHSFFLFIGNALDILAGAGQARGGVSWLTDQPISVRAMPGVKEIVVTGVQGPALRVSTERKPGASGIDGDDLTALGVLTRAGLYSVQGAIPEDRAIAVNLANAAESAVAARDELKFGEITPVKPRVPENAGPSATGGREIWRWFVLIAIALLTIEWAVYAWLMKT